MTNLYNEGDIAVVTADFKVSGVPSDPTTVTLIFRCLQNPEVETKWVYGGAGFIQRDSVGSFYADLDTTGRSGTWVYDWIGTGAAQAARSGSFSVTRGH